MFSKIKSFFTAHTFVSMALMLVVGFALAFIPAALIMTAKDSAVSAVKHPYFPVILIAAFAGALVVFIFAFHKKITADVAKAYTTATAAFHKASNITLTLTEAEVRQLKAVVANGGAFTRAEFDFLKNQAVIGITSSQSAIPSAPLA